MYMYVYSINGSGELPLWDYVNKYSAMWGTENVEQCIAWNSKYTCFKFPQHSLVLEYQNKRRGMVQEPHGMNYWSSGGVC